jgi:hypothetical protein
MSMEENRLPRPDNVIFGEIFPAHAKRLVMSSTSIIRAIRQIVLSLDRLHGLTRATFPWPIRDDLEL